MTRRDFLRNLLYGAGTAMLPFPALGESEVCEIDAWEVVKGNTGWKHIVCVFHSETVVKTYLNGCEITQRVPVLLDFNHVVNEHPFSVVGWVNGHQGGEISGIAVYDKAIDPIAHWNLAT